MNKIIKFSAEWCGPCRAMKPHFNEFQKDLKEINSEVEIMDLNVDQSPAEAEMYGVRSIPYTVFVKDGKVAEDVRGIMTKTDLMKVYQQVYS